jgi:uncharacterized protein (DUF1778 family)
MQRVTQFAFRVNDNERRAITDLAARLQRSQSDAVRFVVVEAAKQLIKAEHAVSFEDSKTEQRQACATA